MNPLPPQTKNRFHPGCPLCSAEFDGIYRGFCALQLRRHLRQRHRRIVGEAESLQQVTPIDAGPGEIKNTRATIS
jgi:hypothetical protein